MNTTTSWAQVVTAAKSEAMDRVRESARKQSLWADECSRLKAAGQGVGTPAFDKAFEIQCYYANERERAADVLERLDRRERLQAELAAAAAHWAAKRAAKAAR